MKTTRTLCRNKDLREADERIGKQKAQKRIKETKKETTFEEART